MNAYKVPPHSTLRMRAAICVSGAILAALLPAGGRLLSAAETSVRLLSVAAQGSAVLIDASEPVAYTVSRPDPLTIVVDLRGTDIREATSRVQPASAVSAVRVEQATAADGLTVARVRLSLARQSDYTVRSTRNTIRVDLMAPGGQASPAAGAAAVRTTPPAGTSKPAGGPSTSAPAASLAAPTRPSAPAAGVEAMAALATSPRRVVVLPPDPSASAALLQAHQDTMTATAVANGGSATDDPAAQVADPVEPPVVSPELQGPHSQHISTGQERTYTGHPISMDFQGVDLRSVLRTFAEISGLNMVIDPDVQGTVDIVLTDVPWDQALEVILRGNALDYSVDGTIVRIARIETLRREQDARTQLAQSAANAGALAVRTYPLSYAKADQAAPLISKAVLSPRGNVEIDARTNTLIITDLPARLETVTQLLATLDRPEPQVEIEARIITTTREFARALGVQWGFNGRVSPDIGNTTTLAFPNSGSLGGRTGVQGPGGTDVRAGANETTGTAVNLGVPAATSAVGLALGSINGAFNLDVALSALERTGKGRILSTPRVTTQNNVEAEITQGVQIPVQTEANNTVTVTFKDAALTLKVTPQITAANTVIMQISLENATPGNPVLGIPSINTQRAIAKVQVSDGMTTVMGGIFVSREQTTHDRTPILHRVPFLGWLFKRDDHIDESRELLIFITPRIQRG
jgi:type IV pilus secretin PilQ/predicted competence protein